MIRQEMALLKMKLHQEDGDEGVSDEQGQDRVILSVHTQTVLKHCRTQLHNHAESRPEHKQRRDEMRTTLMQIARDLSFKQEQARSVFKPSHILPTCTVEQAGLMELEQVRS